MPDDVGILLKVDGLLTARGGSTSHAAVTIPQLNKVGVVGFSLLKVYEREGYSTVEDTIIRSGDFIGIDGWSGNISGVCTTLGTRSGAGWGLASPPPQAKPANLPLHKKETTQRLDVTESCVGRPGRMAVF